ncbi:MAG: type II secretion system major pseudopilin GspG [Methylophilaceae bacterium]
MDMIKKNKGFTLLELLVVMVIIGLLAGYVGPKYFNKLGESQVQAAKAQMNAFSKALDVYRLDHGAYPDQQSGLNALITAPQSGSAKWKGPYLKKTIPKDPWDKMYIYRMPGENSEFDLISHGADGRAGGAGDNADIIENP